MSIPGSAEPLLLAQQSTGYNIERSLRFNSSDSAYLSRTPASAGNRKTWTWSGWVKRSKLGINTGLLIVSTWPSPAEFFEIRFQASDTLDFGTYSGSSYAGRKITSARYRDTSSWYHIVATFDSTNATASDRMRLYVNGERVTAFDTSTDPALNTESLVNSTVSHAIARFDASSEYVDGYLADIHFIDGQALTPSSFAETNATTGQWVPKAYSGSYGTNGFQLKFADNSAATATTLGKDTSGNGNNWTPNNLSVTAGAGNDSLVDTPTSYGTDTGAGGEVRGNYATLNPLDASTTNITLQNGNLDCNQSGADAMVRGTIGVSSGKWYWEATLGNTKANVGIAKASAPLGNYLGSDGNGWGYYSVTGHKVNSGGTTSYGATATTGDVIGIAFDADNGTLVFYKNGVSQGTAFTGLTNGPYFPAQGTSASLQYFNFGQRPFAYAAPSGFKALCTQNLPTPTITKPSTVMDALTWTGTSANQTVSGLNFNPDLIWIKIRSDAKNHAIQDSVRGFTTLSKLSSSGTFAEGDTSNMPDWAGYVNGATSTGFTLTKNGTGADDWVHTNKTGNTYVGWCWDAGSSTVTNTQGSITSQVRANASAGFSVVTYAASTSGSGVSATIGHGLGVAPSMIIVKSRNFADSWYGYHSSVGNTQFLELQSTVAATTFSTMWNNTNPTSTVFSTTYLNQQSRTYVAYCFAPVAGYSSFGSYTGNGSADGPFVYTGFRPRWILIKRTDTVGSWWIFDAARTPYNTMTSYLFADLSNAETTDPTQPFDFTSNGFKLRTATYQPNTNGGTFVYACFAENPFQYARAR